MKIRVELDDEPTLAAVEEFFNNVILALPSPAIARLYCLMHDGMNMRYEYAKQEQRKLQ